MKLEDLTKLGIAEETAKQVIAMNDAEISAEQKKLADKDAELTMATDKIGELTETVKKFDGVDVEKLKADLAEMSKKYADDTAALKLDNALSLLLAGSGAKDAEIVKGLIDKSIVKLDDGGKLTGVSEQLDKLRQDKAFLFESNDGTPVNTGFTHGDPPSGNSAKGSNFLNILKENQVKRK